MPQAIGAALIAAVNAVVDTGVTASTTFAAAGVTFNVAEVVGTVALQALSIGAGVLLAPGAPNPQSQKVNVKAPVQPRRRGYGATKIGGTVGLATARVKLPVRADRRRMRPSLNRALPFDNAGRV